MESYLYCGSSKLIAKHRNGVQSDRKEADCGCAARVDVMLEVGSVALRGVVL